MSEEILYVRTSQELKENLRVLAKERDMTISKYVIDVLINHIKMMKILRVQQVPPVVNPSFIEAVQFTTRAIGTPEKY